MSGNLADPIAFDAGALSAECDFLAAIIDSQAALLIVIDGEDRLVRANRCCEAVSGYGQAELQTDLGWLGLFSAADRESVRQGIEGLRAGGLPFHIEARWRCQGGQERLISWTFTSLRPDSGRLGHVIGTGMDISAERSQQERMARHQEELVRLDRLLTAGELAAHIAHEVNQPLAAITAYGEASRHLLEAGAPRERLQANLEKIAHQALRAGNIIKLLRGPVTLQRTHPQPASLDALVNDALQLTTPYARRAGVDIIVDLEPNLPPVMATALLVEYALVSLIRNAVESLRAADSPSGSIRIETRRVQDVARVSVRDSGPGLDAGHVGQLFDVFHTNWPDGLGMGLRCSRRIVESLQGQLWAEADQPGGVFHFTLPFAA